MKRVYLFVAVLAIISCNQSSPGKEQTAKDSPQPAIPTTPITDSLLRVAKDSQLLKTSAIILQLLKKKDLAGLASFVHPSKGVRFSPYGFIDTVGHKTLTAAQLRSSDQLPEKITWGSYDGSGDPIQAGIQLYFDKFVYDVDFLKAEKKAVNQFLGSGNSLNNLREVYPNSDFTEFYFSGFDPKYGGMDWRTLRLVFRTENKKTYLVGIVHDQWTI